MQTKMSQHEAETLKNFIINYNIRDITSEPVQTRYAQPIKWSDYTYNSDMYFHTEQINMFKMTMPEDTLKKIVSVVTEFDELMRDPETAKLLMEARFINRLKYGSKI